MGMTIARRTDLETGHWVEIIRDFDMPENPIRDWDWLGTLTLTRRYSAYGNDSEYYANDDKFQKYLRAVRISGGVAIPVFCIEHGGIAFSSGAFSDPWDSGLAGFAWMSPTKVKEDFRWDKKAAVNHLEQMISVLDAYAQGECYSYVLYDTDGGEVEHSYGFWNLKEHWQDFMNEMAEYAPDDFAPLIRDCWIGEFDRLDEIPARRYVPGFAPAV